MRLDRRLFLLAPLAVAACAAREPRVFEPLDYDYLTKIKLDVGQIDIEDAWAPRGAGRHVEFLAPSRPQKTLRLMAEQRLVAGGLSGRAVFGIDDASIILVRGRFEGHFAVRLELFDAHGAPSGSVQAQVRGARAATDAEDEEDSRADLDALVRRMMSDLNVEFEFQVRNAFKGQMQSTAPAAPAPESVDTENLAAPPKKP